MRLLDGHGNIFRILINELSAETNITVLGYASVLSVQSGTNIQELQMNNSKVNHPYFDGYR